MDDVFLEGFEEYTYSNDWDNLSSVYVYINYCKNTISPYAFPVSDKVIFIAKISQRKIMHLLLLPFYFKQFT